MMPQSRSVRRLAHFAILICSVGVSATQVSSQVSGPTVNRDDFARAETDTYFSKFVAQGAFGKLVHDRNLVDVNHQSVIRMNRDTVYSKGVFDLDAGPVTISLPDSHGRFMSLLLVSEDHYNPATYYEPGKHVITRDQVGTRYVAALVRIFVDPSDPTDLHKVHSLQDAIRVQQAGTGKFEVPRWDEQSLSATRAALNNPTGFDPRKAFGTKEEVEPTAHLIGTAMGWGGNPARDATYVPGQPVRNDGQTIHRLTVRDVPVDGFWSITVYNKDGFMEPNPQGAYSLNSVTAKKDASGSYTIQFGGCGEAVRNCLPITPGWNYTVRLYRPQKPLLDGSWKFPDAQPVG
jgi:hypothetical protein